MPPKGHTKSVRGLAFSKGRHPARLVRSGGMVNIWDLTTNKLQPQGWEACAIAISPDNMTVAAGPTGQLALGHSQQEILRRAIRSSSNRSSFPTTASSRFAAGSQGDPLNTETGKAVSTLLGHSS